MLKKFLSKLFAGDGRPGGQLTCPFVARHSQDAGPGRNREREWRCWGCKEHPQAPKNANARP